MWNVYTQGILAAIVISIMLAVIVLKNNPQRKLNKVYVYPALFYLFWNITVIIDKIFLPGSDLGSLTRSTLFFLPVGTFHFVLVFLRTEHRYDWLFLKIMYAVSCLSFFLFLELDPHLVWPRYFFAAYSLPFIVRGVINLFAHFKRSVSLVEKYQIMYLAGGIFLWVMGATADLLRFPTFGIYPVSSLGGLAFLGIAAWSVIRLRMADIRVLTGKIIIYLAFVFMFSLLYVLFSQSWPDTHFGKFLNVVFSVVLLLLIYEPVTQKVGEWSDKVLLRESIQLINILKDLHHSLVTMIDSNQVYRTFLQTMSKAEKIATVNLFLREGNQGDYYPFHSPFFAVGRLTKIEKEKPIIEYLAENKNIIVRDEIERELQMSHLPSKKKKLLAVYRTMTVLEAEICVPLMFQNQLKGFIAVRSTETTSSFNRREKELLSLLANQMGIITENTRLYTLMKKQDRLAAIGQMSSGLAHEIRNPLGALKAVAQHLESAHIESDLKEFLAIIVDEVNRLNDVVVRFLSFAQPLKLNLNETDLNNLVEKTVNLLKNEQSFEYISFTLDLEDKLPFLVLDESQIKQVLLNLLLNAQQAIVGSGHITISTELVKRENLSPQQKTKRKNTDYLFRDRSEHEQSLSTSRTIVELSVKDTGTGISEDHLDKIFTPFFSTKECGSGLGLSIAHQIIESHGAEIEVHSHQGFGTKFVIRFHSTVTPLQINTREP